jgi:hypothetical protein
MSIIPTSFQLAGMTITVEKDDALFKERKILGEALYPQQKIVLDSDLLHPESQEQNFLHELVHWLLYVMNEDDLRNNEKFVDLFSFLLHQALTTQIGSTHD